MINHASNGRLMRSLFQPFLIVALFAVPAHAGKVTCVENDSSFLISNGSLSARINKRSARVTSVVLDGQELLGGEAGYWSMAASSNRTQVGGFGSSESQSISIDPKSNDGARAEVVCKFLGKGTDGAYPGESEIRYSIARDSTTLYACAILKHGENDAPFRIGEGRFVIKMDPAIFDRLSIDKDRDRVTPTGKDWDQGSPLNLKEARRMTTGACDGMVEHKYGYSAILGDVPAYGWSGSKRNYGVWMINPSVEYIAGGPTKMELTGHLDVGNGGAPTLLNMWHGSHYAGTALGLAANEKWSKVIGPFAIHFNHGAEPAKLWDQARQQAAVERKAWPYPWMHDELYPAVAERGGIAGKISVDEKFSHPGRIHVGLVAPEYPSGGMRGPRENIGWQRDGKFYQYWTEAAADGSFSLPAVRPGSYELHAFADGVLGEFVKLAVVITAGGSEKMDEIRWVPQRAGPTLWEIGIPDRSAAEFRNGDQYWNWGNYLKFKTDFPNGVDYAVGKSDWKKDWHLCQPLDLSADCEVLGPSTWTVRFSLDSIPANGTRLRVSFCGSREGAKLAFLLNGSQIGTTLALPEDGTMHRDSCRGMWFEKALDIPAARLKTGENVLQFRLSGSAWHQGVLYDYLRMEEVAAPAPSL
ncbi:MAG: polysaccharide lyase family protein [Luteolibacter sp.]